MSKITFRADDELITRLEDFEASKSEIMRDALREYLDDARSATPEPETPTPTRNAGDSLDELVADRVDAMVAETIARTPRPDGRDVNINITLDAPGADVTARERNAAESDSEGPAPDQSGDASHERGDSPTDDETTAHDETTCSQCGNTVSTDHVYCPNCGEKANQRIFCDCGTELRSDWAFCPGCGQRTPAADVLDGD